MFTICNMHMLASVCATSISGITALRGRPQATASRPPAALQLVLLIAARHSTDVGHVVCFGLRSLFDRVILDVTTVVCQPPLQCFGHSYDGRLGRDSSLHWHGLWHPASMGESLADEHMVVDDVPDEWKSRSPAAHAAPVHPTCPSIRRRRSAHTAARHRRASGQRPSWRPPGRRARRR